MIVEVSSPTEAARRRKGRPWPSTLRAARPDRDVRILLRRLHAGTLRKPSDLSLVEGRRGLQLLVKAYGTREPVEAVSERRISGPAGPIPLRIYVPRAGSAPRPVLVWFHGGGFVAGDLYTAGGTCRALANRSGAVVVAVDYRLAPEWDLDVAREDCLAAVRWAAERAAEIGGDPRRLAVGGDSAGGNLAALVALECARAGGPALRQQVLVYPSTDLPGTYPSHEENARGHFLTRESIDWIKAHLEVVSDLRERRFSPLHAPDFRGVAPALVLTAGFDPIRDEGLVYAERLRKAGVPVRSLHYPGQIHGFLCFDRVLEGARDALDRIGRSLAESLADERAAAAAAEAERVDAPFAAGWGLSQRWREAVVATVIVREWVQRTADAGLERVWRFWNLPSASELDRLREQLASIERRIDRMRRAVAPPDAADALEPPPAAGA